MTLPHRDTQKMRDLKEQNTKYFAKAKPGTMLITPNNICGDWMEMALIDFGIRSGCNN